MLVQPTTYTEAFLTSAIRSAPIAMIAMDEEMRVLLINPRGRNYLYIDHLGEEEILGKPLVTLLPKVFREKIEGKLQTGKLNFDLPEIKLGERHITVRCRPVTGGALLTFMNISKLKEAQSVAYNAMLEGQEAERRRFAQELHDGIGPLLSALKLNIEHLQPLEDRLDPDSSVRFENVVGMIDQLTQEIRSISHSLMPAALLDFGLNAALQQLCNRFSLKGKTNVVFYSNNAQKRFDPATELGLYRIGQELLNNALKYAKATEINMQLIRHGHSVVLMVEDDGQGFAPNVLKEKLGGIGFMDIQERVKFMKGHFTIESAPGEGFLATVEVPIPAVNISR